MVRESSRRSRHRGDRERCSSPGKGQRQSPDRRHRSPPDRRRQSSSRQHHRRRPTDAEKMRLRGRAMSELSRGIANARGTNQEDDVWRRRLNDRRGSGDVPRRRLSDVRSDEESMTASSYSSYDDSEYTEDDSCDESMYTTSGSEFESYSDDSYTETESDYTESDTCSSDSDSGEDRRDKHQRGRSRDVNPRHVPRHDDRRQRASTLSMRTPTRNNRTGTSLSPPKYFPENEEQDRQSWHDQWSKYGKIPKDSIDATSSATDSRLGSQEMMEMYKRFESIKQQQNQTPPQDKSKEDETSPNKKKKGRARARKWLMKSFAKSTERNKTGTDTSAISIGGVCVSRGSVGMPSPARKRCSSEESQTNRYTSVAQNLKSDDCKTDNIDTLENEDSSAPKDKYTEHKLLDKVLNDKSLFSEPLKSDLSDNEVDHRVATQESLLSDNSTGEYTGGSTDDTYSSREDETYVDCTSNAATSPASNTRRRSDGSDGGKSTYSSLVNMMTNCGMDANMVNAAKKKTKAHRCGDEDDVLSRAEVKDDMKRKIAMMHKKANERRGERWRIGLQQQRVLEQKIKEEPQSSNTEEAKIQDSAVTDAQPTQGAPATVEKKLSEDESTLKETNKGHEYKCNEEVSSAEDDTERGYMSIAEDECSEMSPFDDKYKNPVEESLAKDIPNPDDNLQLKVPNVDKPLSSMAEGSKTGISVVELEESSNIPPSPPVTSFLEVADETDVEVGLEPDTDGEHEILLAPLPIRTCDVKDSSTLDNIIENNLSALDGIIEKEEENRSVFETKTKTGEFGGTLRKQLSRISIRRNKSKNSDWETDSVNSRDSKSSITSGLFGRKKTPYDVVGTVSLTPDSKMPRRFGKKKSFTDAHSLVKSKSAGKLPKDGTPPLPSFNIKDPKKFNDDVEITVDSWEITSPPRLKESEKLDGKIADLFEIARAPSLKETETVTGKADEQAADSALNLKKTVILDTGDMMGIELTANDLLETFGRTWESPESSAKKSNSLKRSKSCLPKVSSGSNAGIEETTNNVIKSISDMNLLRRNDPDADLFNGPPRTPTRSMSFRTRSGRRGKRGERVALLSPHTDDEEEEDDMHTQRKRTSNHTGTDASITNPSRLSRTFSLRSLGSRKHSRRKKSSKEPGKNSSPRDVKQYVEAPELVDKMSHI